MRGNITNIILVILLIINFGISMHTRDYTSFIAFVLLLIYLELLKISDNLKDIKDENNDKILSPETP